jgi:uncharacterized protein (DUF4415 family)
MRKEYDFRGGERGRYNDRLERGKITIRLEEDVIDYFKKMAKKKGVPYQTLINLYLRDCKERGVELKMEWDPRST